MAQTAEKPQMTLEAYLDFEMSSDERHEFINGVAYAMAGGTRLHARIGGNIFFAVTRQLREAGSDCIAANSDQRLFVESSQAAFYPDVGVYCDQRNHHVDREALTRPTVIFEVLSRTTEDHDRGTKFQHYKGIPSLQEYFLVETRGRVVEHRVRMPDGGWRIRDILAEDLEIGSLKMTVPFSEIYRDTDVPPGPVKPRPIKQSRPTS